MFRLVKIQNVNTEIISAGEDEEGLLIDLKIYVREHASNGDEYTSCDLEAIAEQRYEKIGDYKVEVDEVSILTDDEIVARGGGVCAHCHSDETNPEGLVMDEGFVTRKVTCELCKGVTNETYTLSGINE